VKRSEIAKQVKGVIKEVLPPGLLRLARPFRKPPQYPYGYFGDYPTFEAAKADCKTDGYADASIVESVSRQTRELKQRWSGGAAAVLLDARGLQNLAGALLAVSGVSHRPLSVLDFGGGLGIHYYQLSPFLPGGADLSWLVCETVAMAEEGNRHFAAQGLRFAPSLDQAPGPFDLLISSGAIQCLPAPLETLASLAARSDHLLFNRLPLLPSERDRLTIHRVDPVVYAGEIPIWFLSERCWFAKLGALGFEVAMRWSVPEDTVPLDGASVVLQGLLARRRAR
jgi:putative methyltransferase (TIGR04325 family)